MLTMLENQVKKKTFEVILVKAFFGERERESKEERLRR